MCGRYTLATPTETLSYGQQQAQLEEIPPMLRKLIAVSIFLLLFTAPAYGDGLEGCEHHVTYGAPSMNPVLLCRLGYALSHNPKHKVPDWVAYRLTREKMRGTHPRSNDFRADP